MQLASECISQSWVIHNSLPNHHSRMHYIEEMKTLVKKKYIYIYIYLENIYFVLSIVQIC